MICQISGAKKIASESDGRHVRSETTVDKIIIIIIKTLFEKGNTS